MLWVIVGVVVLGAVFVGGTLVGSSVAAAVAGDRRRRRGSDLRAGRPRALSTLSASAVTDPAA